MSVLTLLITCGALLFADASAQAQPPAGDWRINANGHEGDLVFDSITDGKVEGLLLGDKIRGFYDEKTKCLSLLRIQQDGAAFQSYKGYLFLNSDEKQVRYTIAGVFQVYGGEGATGAEYGWYAQVTKAKE